MVVMSREARYREILESTESVQEWTNEDLVLKFLDVRFIIMTESGVPLHTELVGVAIQVGRKLHEEILLRMSCHERISDAPPI